MIHDFPDGATSFKRVGEGARDFALSHKVPRVSDSDLLTPEGLAEYKRYKENYQGAVLDLFNQGNLISFIREVFFLLLTLGLRVDTFAADTRKKINWDTIQWAA